MKKAAENGGEHIIGIMLHLGEISLKVFNYSLAFYHLF